MDLTIMLKIGDEHFKNDVVDIEEDDLEGIERMAYALGVAVTNTILDHFNVGDVEE